MSESESTADDDSTEDWTDLAEQLEQNGGLPPRRAQAVALVAHGRTYCQAAEELGLTGDSPRSQIGKHVRLYRDDLDRARWLVENGPEV